MNRPVDRFVALVVTLLMALAGLPSATWAQASGPEETLYPEVPIRKLASVSVPSEPRLPSPPGEPADIAARWSSATSDEDRVHIVLDVLAGIDMGVYAMDGTPILLGAERGADDPWLYDFEVALIARDPETVASTTVRDIAATLGGAVSTPSGRPISGEQVAAAVQAALARAIDDPSDAGGFPLRLARELERGSSGHDLAEEVPVDEPLTSLAATLIALDLVLGLGDQPSDGVALAPGGSLPLVAAGPSVSAATRSAPRGSPALGRPLVARPLITATTRTAQGCGSITGAPGAGSSSAGGSGRALVALTSLIAPPAGTIGRMAHAGIIIRALQPKWGADPKKIHYRHRSSQKSDIVAFAIYVDVELPPGAAACGPLAGVRFPPPGLLTRVPLTWDTSRLAEHGQITCGSSCATTGTGGWAELGFLAKVEPVPANLGPIQELHTTVAVRADLGAVLGGMVPAMSFSGPVLISRHRPYEFDLFIDSSIRGTGLGHFVANADGRVHIRDEGGSLLGTGRLKVRSRPAGRADGCKQEYTSSGSGTVDMAVYGLEVLEFPKKVTVYIDPGPELEFPDKLTSPACPPYRPRASVTDFSTWEHSFVDSHRRNLKKGSVGGIGGLRLVGWKWKAAEETFKQGGLLAKLEYPERCRSKVVGCKGLTKFSLAIWPIED